MEAFNNVKRAKRSPITILVSNAEALGNPFFKADQDLDTYRKLLEKRP
jgi:hypothetical protein